MGFFSLFRKTVSQEEFDFKMVHIAKELQELHSFITNDREFIDKNFNIIENRLNVLQNSQDNLSNMLVDLKLFGKLTLDNKAQVETLLQRIENIENQLSQPVVNFSKPSQQGLVNFSKRLVNVDQRFTRGLLEENAVGASDFEIKNPSSPRNGDGLLNISMLTNTEKTLLLAMYDVQADSEVGAIGLKELMEKIYGANATHSKLVYVSKMVKDLASKGAVKRMVRGNHSKVHLTKEAVSICEETLRSRQ